MQQDRCTGHCCRAFNVGPHASLKEKYERAKARLADGYPDKYDLETIQIFEMIIPLPAKATNGTANPYEPTNSLLRGELGSVEEGELHTCKHLQPNGDCGNYENRPEMCRVYPNGRPCVFVHCTSKEARNLPERVWSNASTGFKEIIPIEALTRKVPIRLKPKTVRTKWKAQRKKMA